MQGHAPCSGTPSRKYRSLPTRSVIRVRQLPRESPRIRPEHGFWAGWARPECQANSRYGFSPDESTYAERRCRQG